MAARWHLPAPGRVPRPGLLLHHRGRAGDLGRGRSRTRRLRRPEPGDRTRRLPRPNRHLPRRPAHHRRRRPRRAGAPHPPPRTAPGPAGSLARSREPLRHRHRNSRLDPPRGHRPGPGQCHQHHLRRLPERPRPDRTPHPRTRTGPAIIDWVRNRPRPRVRGPAPRAHRRRHRRLAPDHAAHHTRLASPRRSTQVTPRTSTNTMSTLSHTRQRTTIPIRPWYTAISATCPAVPHEPQVPTAVVISAPNSSISSPPIALPSSTASSSTSIEHPPAQTSHGVPVAPNLSVLTRCGG